MPNLARYHWKRDTPDSRDHLFAPTIATLPAKIDLRPGCSPVEDQGALGSCTGNAIAGIVEYMDRKAGKMIDVSRLFIYYEERVLINTVNYDSGAYIRDGIKVVNKKGACLETLWPYMTSRYRTKPSTQAYNDALKRRAAAYQKCANFTAVKQALAQGYPVVVGFDVYESFESQTVATTGIMPYPASGEQLLGGHAVAIVGYNDVTQRFTVRNSWGIGWGDRGYFYMPYQVIQNNNMSDDFWIITSIVNP